MKRITLPQILHCLETMTVQVEVDPAIAVKAKAAVDRMLRVKIPTPVKAAA
jgi:quinolinate synthase